MTHFGCYPHGFFFSLPDVIQSQQDCGKNVCGDVRSARYAPAQSHRSKTENHLHPHRPSFTLAVLLAIFDPFEVIANKIAVARVTVWRSIIVSLYTEVFPLRAVASPQKLKKKSVSQSTRIALKRIEMQKKFLPLMSVFSLCRRMLKF